MADQDLAAEVLASLPTYFWLALKQIKNRFQGSEKNFAKAE
jgi:hypothetical protein